MEEIWKEIDDRYSVSNFGRVKSNYANKERILKPTKNHYGYLMVDLRHSNIKKTISVHRLVALAFIPNPDNLKEVNHKDENKENNHVDNLEWCTTLYNCNYGTRNERKGKACRKSIFSIDEYGNIEHYDSTLEASEITGIEKTAISKVLSDKFINNKTAGGKRWFYNGTEINRKLEMKICRESYCRKIYSVDDGDNIIYYDSISEAARITGCHSSNIVKVLNGERQKCRNLKWFYENSQITNND